MMDTFVKIIDATSARKYLGLRGLLEKNKEVTPDIITELLLHVAGSDSKLPKPIQNTITAVAHLVQEVDLSAVTEGVVRTVAARLEPMIKDLGKSIETAENGIARLQSVGVGLTEAAAQAIKASESTCATISECVTYAQSVTGGMVTDAQGVHRIGGLSPAPRTIDDVRVRTRMANQACQLLMDRGDRRDGEERPVDDMLKTELIKEANRTLTAMQTGTELKARFLRVERLNHGGLLWEMDSPGSVEWLRSEDKFDVFASQFRPELRLQLQKKFYEVLISNLKVSFRPEQDIHELEEVNGIPAGTIDSVRWVKPINRRDKDQRRAWVAARFQDVDAANHAILNGIRFADEHHECQKTIREPVRCMKCQRYGHMVRDCRDSVDTCGSCGSDHRTGSCD